MYVYNITFRNYLHFYFILRLAETVYLKDASRQAAMSFYK